MKNHAITGIIVFLVLSLTLLALLSNSGKGTYETASEWQTFFAGIIGFMALAWATIAGMAANRARDDRLREHEARAIAAALAAEFRAHLRRWYKILDNEAVSTTFPINFTMYNALADKIGLLGSHAAQVIVMTAGEEIMMERVFIEMMGPAPLHELDTQSINKLKETVPSIEIATEYLEKFAETGKWPPPPVFI